MLARGSEVAVTRRQVSVKQPESQSPGSARRTIRPRLARGIATRNCDGRTSPSSALTLQAASATHSDIEKIAVGTMVMLATKGDDLALVSGKKLSIQMTGTTAADWEGTPGETTTNSTTTTRTPNGESTFSERSRTVYPTVIASLAR